MFKSVGTEVSLKFSSSMTLCKGEIHNSSRIEISAGVFPNYSARLYSDLDDEEVVVLAGAPCTMTLPRRVVTLHSEVDLEEGPIPFRITLVLWVELSGLLSFMIIVET